MPNQVRLPSISFIVARSYPGSVIGYKNKLPWHLKSDLRRFKEITLGHAIIMGRTTFESIGRPLPLRTNVVMSRNTLLRNNIETNIDEDTNLHFANTLADALFYSDIVSILREKNDIFVIGGSMLYTLFDKFVNKVYLTQVFGEFHGDAFFETEFLRPDWRIVYETDFPKNYQGDDYPYRFSIHERKKRRYRYEREDFVSQFFAENRNRDSWVKDKIKKNPEVIERYIQENLDLGL